MYRKKNTAAATPWRCSSHPSFTAADVDFFLLEFSRCCRESLFHVHRAKAAAKKKKTAFSALYRHLFFVHRRGLRLRDIYVSPYNPNSTLILSTNIHLSFIHSKFMTLNPFRALKLFLMDNSWLMEVKAALQQLIEAKTDIQFRWNGCAQHIYESYIWIIHNQLS